MVETNVLYHYTLKKKKVNETSKYDFIYLGKVNLFLFCVTGIKIVGKLLGVFQASPSLNSSSLKTLFSVKSIAL